MLRRTARQLVKLPTEFETRLYIGGKFTPAKTGKTFLTHDPRTEKPLAAVHEAGEADVDDAVKAARAAFKQFKGMPYTTRRALLAKFAELVQHNADELAVLESLDNGKPYAGSGYSSKVDVSLVADCLYYYAGWADKHQGKVCAVDPAFTCYTRHEPIGVVGQIIPWNFPLLMLAWKLGPALACGNAVVVKTSEKTPLSALRVMKLYDEAARAVGVPEGIVNIISGPGTTGEMLARHPGVDKVAFTGSTPVGQKVMRAAADHVKRVSLELGGKSPLIVMPDADIAQALDASHLGLFMNHGQCCCASSRIFVHEQIYDKFVAAAADAARRRQVGNPFEESTEQGPLVDKIQFDRVLGYVAKGKAEGARIVAGGNRASPTGYYLEPTVFADVKDSMTIAKEEIFGPVMSILKFSTLEEALERANSSHYGLAAGVCSRDVGTALHLANNLEAGTVWVNCYNVFSASAPFGGFKQSGIGRELGEYALGLYSEVKTVYIKNDARKY